MVQVEQHQLRHTAARQGFDGPGADAAQTDHRNAAGTQPCVARVAVEAPQAAEAPLQVGRLGGGPRARRGRGCGYFSDASRSLPACAASDCG